MSDPTLFDSATGWADLSPCDTYRYLPGRRIGDGPRADQPLEPWSPATTLGAAQPPSQALGRSKATISGR